MRRGCMLLMRLRCARRLIIGVERAGSLRSCGGKREELKRLQDSWSVVMRS